VRQQDTNVPLAGGMAVVGFTVLEASAAPAVGALVECLDNARPEVRASAAQSLGKIGPSAASALPRLIKSLGDSVPWVCIWAVQDLLWIPGNPDTVVPPLVVFLDGSHPKSGMGEWEQVAGIAALQWNYAQTATQAIPVLRRLTNDPSAIIRMRAQGLLGTIGKPENPRPHPRYDDYLYRTSQR